MDMRMVIDNFSSSHIIIIHSLWYVSKWIQKRESGGNQLQMMRKSISKWLNVTLISYACILHNKPASSTSHVGKLTFWLHSSRAHTENHNKGIFARAFFNYVKLSVKLLKLLKEGVKCQRLNLEIKFNKNATWLWGKGNPQSCQT